MSDTSKEKYEQSFQEILSTASAKPDNNDILAVHMWEWSPDIRKLLLDKGVHFKEINDVLALLANEKGALYDDSEFGQASRYQICDGNNGMLAIACTGLQYDAPCNLYNESISGTGIMFSGAQPVFAYHMGAGSKYKEGETSILSYNHGAIPIGNPKSKSVKEDAESRLRLMRKVALSNFQHAPHVAEYNEVCVNATMENVSGVLVERVNKFRDGVDGVIESAADGKVWKSYLSEHTKFAERIALAFDECELVAAKMSEKDIEHLPTVVIYQPNAEKAEDRMVHFPPTEKNRAMVAEVLRVKHSYQQAGGNDASKDVGI